MGQEIFALRSGHGAARLLLIHGNMASHRWWLPFMDKLADTFTMLAPDLRGYGDSPGGYDHITLADHAADIKQVVAAQHFAPFILLGHSLGGAVATEYALRYGDDVRGLVLVDTAPLGGMANPDYERLRVMLADKNILALALKATAARPLDEKYLTTLLPDAWHAIPAVIPNTRALENLDFAARVGAFTQPVLVVHGEKDIVVPPEAAAETARAFPHSRLELLPGVGHEVPLEDTDNLARLVREFAQALHTTSRGD